MTAESTGVSLRVPEEPSVVQRHIVGEPGFFAQAVPETGNLNVPATQPEPSGRKAKRVRYSKAFQNRAVRDTQGRNAMSVNAAAKKHGVSPVTLARWVKGVAKNVQSPTPVAAPVTATRSVEKDRQSAHDMLNTAMVMCERDALSENPFVVAGRMWDAYEKVRGGSQ